MTEKKYAKHIVTNAALPADIAAVRPPELDETETIVSWLDGDVLEGASHMACIWYLKATPDDSYPAHTHENDEIVGFFGSNAADPHDLGGEIEFWLEDEQYIIDRSCLIFVPRGMKHCPLVIRRVDRPIFHFTTMLGGEYIKTDQTA